MHARILLTLGFVFRLPLNVVKCVHFTEPILVGGIFCVSNMTSSFFCNENHKLVTVYFFVCGSNLECWGDCFSKQAGISSVAWPSVIVVIIFSCSLLLLLS